jgi:hypothetical protein
MNPLFNYILIINREQAGQTLFLKAVAKQWARQKRLRGLLLHEDNPRTELIIQQGVPRAEASRQVAREINHRIVDLLAEAGLAAVGLHLEKIARFSDMEIKLDQKMIAKVPTGAHIVVSKVVPAGTTETNLYHLATEMAKQLHVPTIIQLEHLNLQGVFVEKSAEPLSEKLDSTTSESGNLITWSIKEWEQAEELLKF